MTIEGALPGRGAERARHPVPALRGLRRLRGRRPGGPRRGGAAVARQGAGNQRDWLMTVAARRRVEALRSDTARHEREERASGWRPTARHRTPTTRSRSPAAVLPRQARRRRRRSRSGCARSAGSGPRKSRARSSCRGDDRAADQRAEDPARRRVRALRRPHRAPRPVPDLQRGLRRQRGRLAAPRRADRRGDPLTRQLRARRPTTVRWQDYGADAADRGAPSHTLPRRSADLADRAGSRRWDRALIEQGGALVERTLATQPSRPAHHAAGDRRRSTSALPRLDALRPLPASMPCARTCSTSPTMISRQEQARARRAHAEPAERPLLQARV